ncbi:serine hydrolase domain-containing protein [Caulobacter rhizosphaerae]|uniref:serine hydrolase domain-containing protein n=1 Tax=Caulobacter rhizosphaerae TaxID=2010972 RepID=UPI0019B94D18|nr:serine hydrolase domain-containing protein [Caulobacter rhizosphaerae]GGL35403.1 serine hydrolase [Caulobacter rhizosphaerae]
MGLATAVWGGMAAAGPRGRGRFDWRLHRPEEAGLSAAGLQGVRASVQKYIDSDQLTGAVTVIVRRNKLVWFEAQGVRDLETREPLRKDDIFRMASSTKPLVALCVLMMLEEGKLSLDDKVSRFIPTFKNPRVVVAPEGWVSDFMKIAKDPSLIAKNAALADKITFVAARREITIKDLLTHIAGLGSIESFGGPSSVVNKIPVNPGETLADVVPRLGGAVLDFSPGERWSYSAVNAFDVLLRIVEITSGQSAEVFMRERLFEPLEMRDTYFNLPSDKADRLVKLYNRDGGTWKPGFSPFGVAPTKYTSGAGGLLSTAHDYIQVMQMLYNKGELNGRRVIGAQSVALMSSNQVGDLFSQNPFGRKGTGFGLGVAVTTDPTTAQDGRGRGAFGWDGAHGTDAWVDPELDLTAAYFVQQPVKEARVDFQKAIRAALAT